VKYREGTSEDFGKISWLLTISNYYPATNAQRLGGNWIVAETDDGEIVGCIWAFAQAPNAYVDYWFVIPRFRKSKVPARLMVAMQHALGEAGVKYVRATVLADNVDATRMVEAIGMYTHDGYKLAYKALH